MPNQLFLVDPGKLLERNLNFHMYFTHRQIGKLDPRLENLLAIYRGKTKDMEMSYLLLSLLIIVFQIILQKKEKPFWPFIGLKLDNQSIQFHYQPFPYSTPSTPMEKTYIEKNRQVKFSLHESLNLIKIHLNTFFVY